MVDLELKLKSGAGDFIIRLSIAMMGKMIGGPAKMAVFASGLMGSISGNAVGTGSITIPLMKRVGFSATFPGAVEAAASTGGTAHTTPSMEMLGSSLISAHMLMDANGRPAPLSQPLDFSASNSAPPRCPIEICIQGDDLDQIISAASEIMAKLKSI